MTKTPMPTHGTQDGCQGPDFLLASYMYALPEERIAQKPVAERVASRLMLLHRHDGRTKSGLFADLLRYLPEKCLLVANNSRVIPARLVGKRTGGGKVEALLLTPLPLLKTHLSENSFAPSGWLAAEAEALLRPAKKIPICGSIDFAENLVMELLERGPFGRCRVRLFWKGDLPALLERHGLLPLPPYIKRGGASAQEDTMLDAERYQTVYARPDKTGSVAAPTAGLHFTPALRKALLDSGREWMESTLYVGYGTFSPVRSEDIRGHTMHAEYAELPGETARAVNQAKDQGRAVIAVGTTTCRTLEGAFACQKQESAAGGRAKLAPFAGWLNTFLYPGRPFNIIDGLITNFHLPGSSLLMLVSALAGREHVLSAYQRAVQEQYRFFSYGDAMLIL